jgi:mannose-6-phosphate isomerase-like protein (cupin superfamily)
MRHNTTTLGIAIAAAFAAGLAIAPAVRYSITEARAAAAPLTPAVIDLASMKHADIPTTPNPEMNSKALVVTDNATVAIQSGNVKKHMHPKTDEIQFIIEGSGSMWIGGERRNSSRARC